MSKFDPSAFTLDRFEDGQRVYVWKKHQGLEQGLQAHGSWGVVGRGGSFVALDSGSRVYADSGAGFMTEGEFAVFDVMDS